MYKVHRCSVCSEFVTSENDPRHAECRAAEQTAEIEDEQRPWLINKKRIDKRNWLEKLLDILLN